ncbi:MAG: flavin reductase family protein [Eubacteriaceae bacterium]|nr:flavin reductase family protein [Eubacteriaceae bacterium]
MYYETDKDDHNLSFSPFKSCVIPRPIGWISTRSADGIDNLAPYSQFQNLTFDPPYVMIGINQNPDGKRKDTTNNIEQTGEFVYNMVTYDLKDKMNKTAVGVDPSVDEFEFAGLKKVPSKLVKPFRVAESPVQMECVYYTTLRLPGRGLSGTVDVIIGKVLAVHIADDVIRPDGRLDIVKIKPLARLGYADYTTVDYNFELMIPTDDEDAIFGLGGASIINSRKK